MSSTVTSSFRLVTMRTIENHKTIKLSNNYTYKCPMSTLLHKWKKYNRTKLTESLLTRAFNRRK